MSASSCVQVDHSNLFIGTGGLAFGYGGVNPGAQVPHGALRLGPDSTNALPDVGYRHFSGYNYLDSQLRMFSHTHFVGAGINGLGNVGVMPVRLSTTEENEELQKWVYEKRENEEEEFNTLVWWSKFSKDSEVAVPGMYSVRLEDSNVDVSLLATGTMTAIHQYNFAPTFNEKVHSFDEKYSPAVVVDVCHAAQISSGITPLRNSDCHNASLTISDDGNHFSASLLGDRDIWIYLYGEFTTPEGLAVKAKKWHVCSNGEVDSNDEADFSCELNASEGSSNNGILFSRLSFGGVDAAESSLIELRVALSYISDDMAKENFKRDFPLDDCAYFEEKSVDTTEKWCSVLDFLTITSMNDDSDLRNMLYSANYRAHMTPTIYTEANGLYVGLDKTVRNVTQERLEKYSSEEGSSKVFEVYSDLSLWDTFRCAHPWLLLTDESLAVGVLRSISEMTEQQNSFPKWVLANTDISCMVGLHGGALAVEAAESGLEKQFDLVGIQKMLQQQAVEDWPKNGRDDLNFYLENGYVSSEANDHSASLTLTYAYDDFVLAKLSDLIGDKSSADSATLRAQNYRNIWSTEKEFMCPRSQTGELQCSKSGSSPDSWQNYVEGDGLHWSYFVLQDPLGLISLYNSTKDFEQQLEFFFSEHVKYTEKFSEAVPNPYFWQGNEVDQYSVWLFNYGSNCTRAQYWSRALTHLHFSNTPHGVPGNEDYGAMASWLLFASLGIFPQAGTTNFMLGSPRVENATLKLEHFNGQQSTLEISTVNNSPENVYVSSLLVNGKEHFSTLIDRNVLMNPDGCHLEFTMSSVAESSLC